MTTPPVQRRITGDRACPCCPAQFKTLSWFTWHVVNLHGLDQAKVAGLVPLADGEVVKR